MPIVNIKYNLDDPEDRMSFERAMYSLDMASYIFEVLHNGKRKFKECECDCVDQIWQYLWEAAKDHKIDTERLIS